MAEKWELYNDMSLPRKGLRKVTVDGVLYEWSIRKKPTYLQGVLGGTMTLGIQLADSSKRTLLIVDLQITRPDNWISEHQTAVTPKVVRSMIRTALDGGWVPNEARRTFRLMFPMIRDRV